MADREKVIKGLAWIIQDDKFGFGENWDSGEPQCDEEKAEKIIWDAIVLLKDQDNIIAALQCALDQANEKLAYLSGEECYHYDCEAGREQLEAWWAALLATGDVEPVRHGRWLTGGYVCGETEWICSVCGESEWRTNCNRMKYCMFCGAKMDLEEDDG